MTEAASPSCGGRRWRARPSRRRTETEERLMIKLAGRFAVFLTLGLSGLAAQTPTQNAADDFYAAIRAGNATRVSALIQSGADVNTKDRRGGATPLMHAAGHGSLETMRLLLDKGADINARNS